jgi:hypothetical protein
MSDSASANLAGAAATTGAELAGAGDGWRETPEQTTATARFEMRAESSGQLTQLLSRSDKA